MTLNSFTFLIFFAIVFILYYTILKKKQQILLLAASIVFVITYKFEYFLLLLAASVVAYGVACFIQKKQEHKKLIAVTGSLFLLGVLFFFKYLNFSFDIIEFLAAKIPGAQIELDLPVLNILLPVGISFYVFQNVGYIWDVYMERIVAERNFVRYLLSISYFPKLTVGPIERGGNLLPQLAKVHEFDYDEAVGGLRIVMIGLFKKIAVADTIAPFVNNVYDNCNEYSGLALIVATVLYAFQIYCDFSGYTDMAIGFSKMLGIHLLENFRCPYLSRSISEFWRRWHISLSSWFRDFVYIPLGGNRVRLIRYMLNTMITFTLSGVWHGASMNFVIWGALNGLFLCIENLYKKFIAKKREKSSNLVLNVIKCGVTFVLVCFSWIFFRAATFADAGYIVKNMFKNIDFSLLYLKQTVVSMGFTWTSCILVLIVLVLLVVIDVANYKRPVSEVVKSQKVGVRWCMYIVLAVIILCCKIYMAESQQFIYFQF